MTVFPAAPSDASWHLRCCPLLCHQPVVTYQILGAPFIFTRVTYSAVEIYIGPLYTWWRDLEVGHYPPLFFFPLQIMFNFEMAHSDVYGTGEVVDGS
jgi:hypothetical protein